MPLLTTLAADDKVVHDPPANAEQIVQAAVFMEGAGPSADIPPFITTTNARELFWQQAGESVADTNRRAAASRSGEAVGRRLPGMWTTSPVTIGRTGWLAAAAAVLVSLGLVLAVVTRGETFGQRCIAAGHAPDSPALDTCVAELSALPTRYENQAHAGSR